MKRRALLKHLREHGCELLREGRRHSVYYSLATRQTTAAPRHAEIIDTPPTRSAATLASPSHRRSILRRTGRAHPRSSRAEQRPHPRSSRARSAEPDGVEGSQIRRLVGEPTVFSTWPGPGRGQSPSAVPPHPRRETPCIHTRLPEEAGEGRLCDAARDLLCGGGSRPSDGPAFCEGAGVGPRPGWPQAKPLASPQRLARLGQRAEEEESGLRPWQQGLTGRGSPVQAPHQPGGCSRGAVRELGPPLAGEGLCMESARMTVGAESRLTIPRLAPLTCGRGNKGCSGPGEST